METYRLLEQEFAEWIGVEPGGMVACSSGTAALTLAFEALRLPLGSSIICSDFSMIACPRSISMAGHEPVFVDCAEDLNIDLSLVEDFLSRFPDGVEEIGLLAVHTYGRKVRMQRLRDIVQRQAPRCFVIEDLAEATGVLPNEVSDAACYSFFKNKIVAGEEGGAVWFCNSETADYARMLRSQGFTDAHDFWHVPRGVNARLSNANAELILASLRNVDENLKRRREAEEWYEELCPEDWKMPERAVPWIWDLRIKDLGWPKMDEVVKELNAVGIAARHSFKPCHLQPEYRDRKYVGDGKSWKASQEVLYLPLTPGAVTKESARFAFETIDRVLTR